MKNPYVNIVLQKNVMKMIDTKKILNKIDNNKKFHDKLVKEGLDNLNEKLRSDKYTIESIIANSELGYKYHDLIDQKDMMNSEFKSNINKSYHSIDVGLYKLNQKLENESRMINYKIDSKKEKILEQIKYRC